MNWQWPRPPGYGYEPQPFPSTYPPQPPHLQHYRPRAQPLPPLPPPAVNPPPPPIAQLLPPVNFLANSPVHPLPTSFVHFSNPQTHRASHNTAILPCLPPQQEAIPPQGYYPVQREAGYQPPRRDRRQSLRLHRERNLQVKPPARRNSSRDAGVTPFQQTKQKHLTKSEQTSADGVLSTLNAKLPGSSTAEIKAWVDARKANWPSKANVARKKATEARQKAAGALNTSGTKSHRAKSGVDGSERDLAVSRSVLSKLNVKLPGSSQEEVEAWVKARKDNWPSRTNVARKLAAAAEKKASIMNSRSIDENKGSGALAKLGDYSSSDDDEEVEAEKEKKSDIMPSKGKRGRRRQGGRGKKSMKKRKTQIQGSTKKPSLLRMLLEREIRQEQSVLLQAFRYIINKKASEN